MKHFTLTLILSSLSIASWAGVANQSVKDSTIIRSEEGLNQLKYVYHYDNSGKKNHEEIYHWELSKHIWLKSTNQDRKYDANGNIQQEINYTWNQSINKWEPESFYFFSYDEMNNKVLEIQYAWDVTITEWVENYKYEISYNEYNTPIATNYYEWSEEREWGKPTLVQEELAENISDNSIVFNNKIRCSCEFE